MGTRRRAREAAVQMLYQIDVSGEEPARAIELYWEYLGEASDARALATELARGCSEQREAIDERIKQASRHWRIDRMARVDRNILRLGTFELVGMPDIPRRVTLNEAVELAKRFGDEQSPAFVNGLLDRIASDVGKA
jgi:N utilization substance protein B